jgi:hypothetical protein
LSLSLQDATGGQDANPFVTANAATTAATAAATAPAASSAAGSSQTGAAATQTAAAVATNAACTTTTSSAASATSSSGLFSYTGGFGPFNGNSYWRRAVASDDCSGNTGTSSSDTSASGSSSSGIHPSSHKALSPLQMKKMAHGVCAGLSFAVLYPLGAIVMRLFSFSGVIWVHAGIQLITNVLFIVGFALGVSLANEIGTSVSWMARSVYMC